MENFNENGNLCRKVNISGGEVHTKVLDELHNVLAARNTSMGSLFHVDVRTDFPLKQEDGTNKWYEEFPTHTNLKTGKSDRLDTDLYEYDPTTDKRGRQLPKDSEEYKAAHDALWVLRDRFTPKVILNLPRCKD